MKNKDPLTTIVIAVLLVMIPVLTFYLQSNGFELRISAFEDADPTNVIISDIKSTSFRVTWTTEKNVIGGVRLNNNEQFMEKSKNRYHTMEIKNLKKDNIYSFSLLSGTKEFLQENGKLFELKTASVETDSVTYLVYGQVFSQEGLSVQKGGIITLRLTEGKEKSQLISTVINESGGYKLDIGGILTDPINNQFNISRNTNIEVAIYPSASPETEPIKKVFTQNLSEYRQIPNIYLGDVNIDIIPGIETK